MGQAERAAEAEARRKAGEAEEAEELQQPAGKRDVRANTGLNELAQITLARANGQAEVRRNAKEEVGRESR